MAYSEQDVERALQCRAICASAGETSQALNAEFGLSIPERTISEWVSKTHRDRYEQIRADIAPKLHAAIASEMEDLAVKIAQVERDAVERVEAQIKSMDGKDAAIALKSLSAARASATDKALVLRGKPNHITSAGEPSDIYARLKALGYEIRVEEAVDGSAEDIPDAELASGENTTEEIAP